jgi:hypothetical protein
LGATPSKDFVAGFIVPYFILTRHPCRIVTSSAKEDHLRVLWGEIGNFISSCKIPLIYHKVKNPTGPLVFNHQELKKVIPIAWDEEGNVTARGICDKSYASGLVASANRIAAMGGHHIASTGDGIPRTLFVGDECSSMPDGYKEKADTWANRMLFIGNTWPCSNFWKYSIEGSPDGTDPGGDLPRPYVQHLGTTTIPEIPRPSQQEGPSRPREEDPRYTNPSSGPSTTGSGQPTPAGYYRRIIRVQATDSPNVRLALAQQAAGLEPTGEVLLPGVKSWQEYQKNLARWDPIKQAVALRAEFYKGKELLLYPEDWTSLAISYWRSLLGDKCRFFRTEAIGIDPGEGGANTSMAAGNRYGLKELTSRKTPDTNDIVKEAKAFMLRHNVPPEMVVFDRGGGGKQHADRLRSEGYRVRTVAFGESLVPDPKHGITTVKHRLDQREDHYAFTNRRAEMYGEFRLLLDPSSIGTTVGDGKWLHEGFCIPPGDRGEAYGELLRQMKPIPLLYDPEGRMKLLPKNKRTSAGAIKEGARESNELTLVELLGCSPDECDSVVLMIHALLHRQRRNVASSGGLNRVGLTTSQ